MILYTDSVEFCLIRAEIRHKKGGHLVKPAIVKEMYEETLPLLKQHLKRFNTFRFVDVSPNWVKEVTQNDIPAWLHDNDMMGLIQ